MTMKILNDHKRISNTMNKSGKRPKLVRIIDPNERVSIIHQLIRLSDLITDDNKNHNIDEAVGKNGKFGNICVTYAYMYREMGLKL